MGSDKNMMPGPLRGIRTIHHRVRPPIAGSAPRNPAYSPTNYAYKT